MAKIGAPPNILTSCIRPSPLAMPRSLLVHPKGGATGKVRKRYAVTEKIMLHEEYVRLRLDRNLSISAAAEELGIDRSVLSRWNKDITRLRANKKSRKLAIADGPHGQLHSIEEELLQWIFARREQGIGIRHTLVAFKASALLRSTFGPKTFNARYKAVQRFMRKHKYVYRQRTNEATRPAQEVIDEATDFLAETRPLLVGAHRDPRYVWNMDQTPIFFSYQSSKTLAKRGVKTVNVRKTTDGTKRATAALTVTAAGDFLMPMIIFKGKPNGHIAKKELPTLDPTSIYACQEAAWMDERCMLIWVEQVLAAYLSANPPPPGIVPVILLDSYRCHMMASVVSKITALGIEVIHIPGGCTGLCQPLDVGINKPFKARVRRQWEEWMTDLIDRTNEVRDATREEVVEWVTAAYWEMATKNKRILRNAWRKTAYDWFPDGLVFAGDDDGGNGGDDGDDDDDDDDNGVGDDDDGDDVWADNDIDEDNYIFDNDMFDDNDNNDESDEDGDEGGV